MNVFGLFLPYSCCISSSNSTLAFSVPSSNGNRKHRMAGLCMCTVYRYIHATQQPGNNWNIHQESSTPGISTPRDRKLDCTTCVKDFSPLKEPMIPTELPQYPWQKVGIDLFHLHGANYLVVVDYFSRCPEVQKFSHRWSLMY